MSNSKGNESNWRGKKKGGTMFPRIKLKQAVEYAKKLVSKTHNGPQPEAVILSGVFGSIQNTGKIKRSALKQFDFIEGDAKGYSASASAKNIAAATPDELPGLLQKAVLQPPIFRKLFDTLQHDNVSVARVKQVAMQNRVHQDSADECVSLFIESAEFAGLAKRNGDQVTFEATPGGLGRPAIVEEADIEEAEGEDVKNGEGGESKESLEAPQAQAKSGSANARGGAFQINLNIDPTMDPEKLEKHLKLLRSYGLC